MLKIKNHHKKRRIVFVSSIFLISLLALAFIIANFRENIVFFYSPSEIKNEAIFKKIKNRQTRAGGLVKENSIKKIDALTTEFIVTDLQEDLKMHYVGILPDLFREKQGVVAKGKFDAENNQFIATELLVKHDEKYMQPEVAKSLKK